MRSNIARTCASGRVPVASGDLVLTYLVFWVLREATKLTSWLNSCGFVLSSLVYGGIGGGGVRSVRSIAGLPRRSPMWVRLGPSVLPFSPTLWQLRQPEEAITSLPFSNCGATFRSISVGEPASAPSTVR